MKYCIGLDIGIASVGYAVLALGHDENPWGIIRMGSRVFDVAETPKTGASLALPRREARSARRRLRRRRLRLERIKELLVASGIVTAEELGRLYAGRLSDIYALRTEALDRPVSDAELARILLNLAWRRGFKSNRKADTADKQAGLMLAAVSENEKRMQDGGYRTVGEMFLKDPAFSQNKRNHGENYLSTVTRALVEKEARAILARQAELGNAILTEEFIENYLAILLGQRLFDEGPGKGSRYSGNQIENMIGKCLFEKGEERAAKACYSFERFNLLCKINHLRLLKDGRSTPLNDEQRLKLIQLAYSKADLNYGQIRKELAIADDTRFNTVLPGGAKTKKKTNTAADGTTQAPAVAAAKVKTFTDAAATDAGIFEKEKKTKFRSLPFYHELRKAFNSIARDHIASFSVEALDAIGNILSRYKGDEKRSEELRAIGLKDEEIDALLPLNPSKFCHLSLKALRKINPYLEQGLRYNDACAKAGYEFRGHTGMEKSVLLPAETEEMEDITSPVVRRAVSQLIKVYNAIVREMGVPPVFVNVELAREMSKSFEERGKIVRSCEENNARNARILKRLKEEFHLPSPGGLDIIKLKLWEEQDGISPYSQKKIELARLFEPGYVDVDHIIPYSVSFDDSLKNKVLVLSSENREKGNRLPLVYLRERCGQDAADRFTVWVRSSKFSYPKKLKLLKAELTEEDLNGFKDRNLQDTQTISRFVHNLMNDHLIFAPSSTGRKKTVTAVNGAITSYLRKRWGITKIRADGDKHHAIDAVVIACATDKLIKDLSSFSRYNECVYEHRQNESLLVNKWSGEIIREFPYPWDDFRKELTARLAENPVDALRLVNPVFYATCDLSAVKPLFVSRAPRRTVTGAAHMETVKSLGKLGQGYAISKKELTKLKLDRKTGEIEGYYNPESDTLLYNALKARLLACGGDGQKAFAEPFYKPRADGAPGNIVKKVKIYEKATLTVPVLRGAGVADNNSMIRTDVYKVEGDGYYLVPVYVSDTVKPKLPNKAIVARKNYSDWPEMRDEDFLFSLYPNDLIRIEHKSKLKFSKVNKESTLADTIELKKAYVYFKGTDISTGSIGVINHDNTYMLRGLGVKTLLSIEKYYVDVLGNYTKVGKEKRRKFR